MTHDLGVPPSGSGHSRAEPEEVSALRASVPNADALVRLMSAWSSIPGAKFHAAYPFFEADRRRVVTEYGLFDDERANLEATALLFAEYADDIYASGIETRRAATTKIGAVHESPTVATSDGDAQPQSGVNRHG